VPYLKEFAALYPHYAFRVSTKTWPDEFANVETDVEIRFDSRKSADSSAQLMQPNAMVVVGAPILCAGVSPHDWVTTLPLIHVVGTADTWQRWADLNAVKDDLSGTYFVESHGNAVDLARTGAGIALTNAFVAAPGLRDGTLTRMPNTQMAALDGYYMQIKKGPNHHIAGIFAKWLREKMASSFAQTLPDQWLTSAE
jgi:DNA-binding transcriptional LysR family regulator